MVVSSRPIVYFHVQRQVPKFLGFLQESRAAHSLPDRITLSKHLVTHTVSRKKVGLDLIVITSISAHQRRKHSEMDPVD